MVGHRLELLLRATLIAMVSAIAPASASAQCTPSLQPRSDFVASPSLRGVRAIGEFAGRLVIAGEFAHVGGVPAANIAIWDGSAWQALGTGTDGRVNAVLEYDAGGVHKLVVAGKFLHAGGIRVDNIAAWDGAAWSALGSEGGSVGAPGLGGNEVFSLATLPSSDGSPPLLFACGDFAKLDGVLRSGCGLAYIDPTTAGNPWLAPFFTNPNDGAAGGFDAIGVPIHANFLAMATHQGQLYVGGSFSMVLSDGQASPLIHLARLRLDEHDAWSFEQVGGQPGDGGGVAPVVQSLAVRAPEPGAFEELIIGTRADAETSQCVWRCDGQQVTPWGDGSAFFTNPNDPNHFETTMAVELFRGVPHVATRIAGQGPAVGGRLLALRQGAWTPVDGAINHEARALRRWDAALLVGGRFSTAAGQPSAYLASYGCPCPADITNDQAVDLPDFFAFFNTFDTAGPGADVDASGEVDLADFFAFFTHFDAGC